MIQGKNIHLTYKKEKNSQSILKNVSFQIEKGSITTFIGKSGAGKTSLLKCLGGLESSYEGAICYEGQELKALSSAERLSMIGFVFQEFHLFPHMTVKENCLHPLQKGGKCKLHEAEKEVKITLSSLGIESIAHAYPSELSGGQKQRVAIARALVLKPKVLLFDEPTSALDPDNVKGLIQILQNLLQQKITLVISSHDLSFLKNFLSKVYFIEEGQIIETFDASFEELKSKTHIQQFLTSGSI